MKKSIEKKVFPNEETFQKIFLECLENAPTATEAIKSSYSGMDSMFNNYIEAIEEWIFRHAYQCGYEAALNEMGKGGDPE